MDDINMAIARGLQGKNSMERANAHALALLQEEIASTQSQFDSVAAKFAYSVAQSQFSPNKATFEHGFRKKFLRKAPRFWRLQSPHFHLGVTTMGKWCLIGGSGRNPFSTPPIRFEPERTMIHATRYVTASGELSDREVIPTNFTKFWTAETNGVVAHKGELYWLESSSNSDISPSLDVSGPSVKLLRLEDWLIAQAEQLQIF